MYDLNRINDLGCSRLEDQDTLLKVLDLQKQHDKELSNLKGDMLSLMEKHI